MDFYYCTLTRQRLIAALRERGSSGLEFFYIWCTLEMQAEVAHPPAGGGRAKRNAEVAQLVEQRHGKA